MIFIKINKFMIEPILIKSKIYNDDRGYFLEIFKNDNKLLNKFKFIQDNLSYSKKGVVRGVHYQLKKPQTKFITIISGKIYDVCIDLRNKSKNFGKKYVFNMSDNKNNQLLVPKGFAHGFQCLSDFAIIHYKCDNYYDSDDQYGVIFNDNTLNIKWPLKQKKISDKDKNLPLFNKNFKYF